MVLALLNAVLWGLLFQPAPTSSQPAPVDPLRAAVDSLSADEVAWRWALLAAPETNLELPPRARHLEEKILRDFEDQFLSEADFLRELSAANLSVADLRRRVRTYAYLLAELEQALTEAERMSFSTASARNDSPPPIELPPRYTVRHLFLASHAETPGRDALRKMLLARYLSWRLQNGADFESLIERYSEDELTRPQAGLLPEFSSRRMPEDFISYLHALSPGEISAPFRTSLGWHIVRIEHREPVTPVPRDLLQAHQEHLRQRLARELGLQRWIEEKRSVLLEKMIRS